jgi:hypothetical protein
MISAAVGIDPRQDLIFKTWSSGLVFALAQLAEYCGGIRALHV